MAESLIVGTKEAAEYLGLRPSTLEIWRCKHKGPRYLKIGRRVMYDVKDLDEFFVSKYIETLESATTIRRHGSQQ